ncbi:DMT family transporter [Ligilactobacillus salivarius]|uniref:DMT family transporter n=1 Tax=Ligilactobacillus salivarius TaxID=1624 RepID=UPI001CC1348F|nr:DMT family transporter [Ligilactobacillus salivarius]MBZ4031772.1 DMT family transporter [Ligilactobacillus salivarius]
MKSSSKVMKGIFWSAVASATWGISGTTIQFISQNQHIPTDWFLSTRTLGSGTILLIISFILYGKKTFNVFSTWKSFGHLFAYATLGLMANLLTFYLAIQSGNASAATILQYLSPLFIVLGGIFIKHQRPLSTDLIAFIISLLGVLLAITKGDLTQMSIPMNSFLWGLGSGITAAFYVVLPRPIAQDNPPLVVLGWGTFIAGVLFNLYHPVWINTPHITSTVVLSISTVILVGTIIPFGLLLYSSRFAPSDVISIMDALQPVTTSILSVIFLGLEMNWVEIVGIILVIVAIYILQRGRRNMEKINYHEDEF